MGQLHHGSLSSIICPGLDLDRVNSLLSSLYNAESGIQSKDVDNTLMFQWLLSSACPELRTFLVPHALPLSRDTRSCEGPEPGQLA